MRKLTSSLDLPRVHAFFFVPAGMAPTPFAFETRFARFGLAMSAPESSRPAADETDAKDNDDEDGDDDDDPARVLTARARRLPLRADVHNALPGCRIQVDTEACGHNRGRPIVFHPRVIPRFSCRMKTTDFCLQVMGCYWYVL